MRKQIDMREDRYSWAYYAPSNSIEIYDEEADQFMDEFGSPYRHPREFSQYIEGYTPFGDE